MKENRQDTARAWVDPDDAPELDDHFFEHAEIREGELVRRPATGALSRRGRPPLAPGARRRAVSLRLSPRVVDYFRQTGPGWQSRIGDVLEQHVERDLQKEG